jgi:nucleoid DNA-binding protein
MTFARMVKELARRTGYSDAAIGHILEQQLEVMKAAIIQEEDILFRGLFRIIPSERNYSVQEPGGGRKAVTRTALTVRPVRSFRKELNAWKSTEFCSTKSSPRTQELLESVLAVEDETSTPEE